MCFPGRGTYITRDMCLLDGEHISLGIRVSQGGGTHITRHMRFPGRGTHITRDICFPDGGTHIARDMCFPGGGTHITRDMCFPGRGTRITRDTYFRVGEQISLEICVSQVREHK